MKQFAPSADLAPFVRVLELVETEADMTRTLLPETGLIVGFRFAGSAALVEGDRERAQPDRALTGLRATARRMHTVPQSGIVVAKLRPAAAGRFFEGPLNDLFDDCVPLEALAPPRALDRASIAIARAKTDAERIATVDHLLRSIARAFQPDAMVHGAVHTIESFGGAVRVGALAEASGLSRDAFEKRFRRAVGASPKQYASTVRLSRAVASIRPGRDLTRVSIDAGYCDQSHFIREFRRVTGQSPRRFLRSGDYCGPSEGAHEQHRRSHEQQHEHRDAKGTFVETVV